MPFHVTEKSTRIGQWSLRLRAYPDGYVQSEHAHRETVLNIVLSGSVVEATASTEATISAWNLYVRNAGVEHRNEYGRGETRVLSIAIEDDTEAERRGDRWLLTAPSGMRALIALLREVHREESRPESTMPMNGLFDPVAWRDRSISAQNAWLDEARRTLDSPRAEIRKVAAGAGMHRVAFARAFRRFMGLSPSEYRRWCRVRRAASRLGEADIPLTEVALESGFSDQSHMCRDFRCVLDVTPTEYRRLIELNG